MPSTDFPFGYNNLPASGDLSTGTKIDKWLGKMDSYGFRSLLAQLEASRFTAEDGKQYIKFPKHPLGDAECPTPPQ
jgi:hypothetical protein